MRLYTRLEIHAHICSKGFLGSSGGTESACNAKTPGRSLDWEDPLEKGTATHSSILAWKIAWNV